MKSVPVDSNNACTSVKGGGKLSSLFSCSWLRKKKNKGGGITSSPPHSTDHAIHETNSNSNQDDSCVTTTSMNSDSTGTKTQHATYAITERFALPCCVYTITERKVRLHGGSGDVCTVGGVREVQANTCTQHHPDSLNARIGTAGVLHDNRETVSALGELRSSLVTEVQKVLEETLKNLLVQALNGALNAVKAADLSEATVGMRVGRKPDKQIAGCVASESDHSVDDQLVNRRHGIVNGEDDVTTSSSLSDANHETATAGTSKTPAKAQDSSGNYGDVVKELKNFFAARKNPSDATQLKELVVDQACDKSCDLSPNCQ